MAVLPQVKRVPEKILGLSDIARGRGITTERAAQLRRRGKLPSPDYELPGGRPGWRRSTLEQAGVIPIATPQEETDDPAPRRRRREMNPEDWGPAF